MEPLVGVYFRVHESWRSRLADEFTKPYFDELIQFVRKERRRHYVFPSSIHTFNALRTPFDDVRVVIMGQDPYINAEQAHGLSFSVLKGVKVPPSLANIYKELAADIPDFDIPDHGCLQPWADQGVLLLNAVLTVRAHTPGSHRGKGWERFTGAILRLVNAKEEPVVFILWGRDARDKRMFLDTGKHTIIESAHPSPLSAHNGFYGSRPFSRTNQALEAAGLGPIDWRL